MNVFQWIKQCSENFKNRHRKYWVSEGPEHVFEALEDELYRKDLEKTIPNSILMKLDKDATVKTIGIPMLLTVVNKSVVDIIRKGNWYV